MHRRGILQLIAAAAGLWAGRGAGRGISANAFQTEAIPARTPGIAPVRITPAAQDRPLPEPLLPLFPLRLVLFPNTDLLLHIFEERYKEMIQDCLQNHWEFGVLLAQEESFASFVKIGCTATISEVIHRYPDGRMNILIRGQRRFEISSLDEEKPYLRGKAQFFADEGTEGDDKTDPADEGLRRQAVQLYGRLMELLASLASGEPSSEEPSPALSGQEVSFQIMAGLRVDLEWKQNVLELQSERERLVLVIRYLQQLIDYLEPAPRQGDPAGMA